MTANSRAVAAGILQKLSQSEGSLTVHLSKIKDRDDAPFVQELCFGCCRWYHLLQAILAQLLDKPVKGQHDDLHCLLLLGLYQLRESSKADYAIINETVSASGQLGKPWARGLVNGVLRNYQRNRQEIDSKLPESAFYSHPAWLRKALQQQWPEQASQIMANANRRPPMTLRCNIAMQSPEQLLRGLEQGNVSGIPGQWAETAIYLQQASNAEALPGFAEGAFSVQDEASQLVPGLLQLTRGQRVLDACAAPGGKACHILESEQSLSELVALDSDDRRAERIGENLQRLQLSACIKVADARDTGAWWDGRGFDRILLDAPCSATGVIRRHPDIKLLRQREDIARLQQLQSELLDALWACLNPGGLLLYTTCSLLRQENEISVANFLARCEDAKYESIAADWGVECAYGRQLLTGDETGPDGFYFALLRKDQGR
jgi:16S rRNA (cytosine967-C5)-methyltransferase